jgi:phage N-6-adenine-methyltransferase
MSAVSQMHLAPFRSTKWSTIDDALADFLNTPCSPPGALFFAEDSDIGWTNERVIVANLGVRGINAPDAATFDAVRLKYEKPVETFAEAFACLATACGRDWASFDLECLRECCEDFRALELPAWIADELERPTEEQLVATKGALFGSADMTWCTPPEVLELVRRLGPIGLDPCSNGRSVVRAPVEWRGKPGVDGLAQSWVGHGLVYCNPPYGRAIKVWMQKCATEGALGAEIIALIPARTDTKWWHESVVEGADSVCFWRGRIAFLGATQGAPFPSALIYYGPRPADFGAIFASVGWAL